MGRPKIDGVGLTAGQFGSLRRASGLTQEQVARLLGLTLRTITRWEAGDSPIGALEAPEVRRRLEAVAGEDKANRA